MNNSNISDWIKYDLSPCLGSYSSEILPEFSFKEKAKYWQSTTDLKTDGSTGEKGKVFIYKNNPSYLKDWTRGGVSIIEFIQKREQLDFIGACKYLSQSTGVKMPESTKYDKETRLKTQQRASLFEATSIYLKDQLETKEANPVRMYLTNIRGYSLEDVKEMGLGFIPSALSLRSHLRSLGFNDGEITTNLTFTDPNTKYVHAIGSTHQLAIPYVSGGEIRGFKFRTIGDHKPKYKNIEGANLKDAFFNMPGIFGDKDLLILEGDLDALHATIKGIDNAVAMSGDSITEGQIIDAKRRGVKKITLCFDAEIGKEKDRINKIARATDLIIAKGINEIYIVDLPILEGVNKTDPDSFILAKGVEEFKKLIEHSDPYYRVLAADILGAYFTEDGPISDKSVKRMEESLIQLGTKIADPLTRDRFMAEVSNHSALSDHGVTRDSLEIALDRLRATQASEAQSIELNKLISDASEAKRGGNTEKAIDLISERLPSIKGASKKKVFESLLSVATESEVVEALANMPDLFDTGYKIGGTSFLIPSGGLTIISGCTNHGKTATLIDLAVKMSDSGKEVHYFGMEESKTKILVRALNRSIGQTIAQDNKKAIMNYFRTGDQKVFDADKVEIFKKGKDHFFNSLVRKKMLNVHYWSDDIDTFVAAIRYLKQNTNIEAVFLDYIQLLKLTTAKKMSRQEELKVICECLKELANDTGLPIILGAQFNREVDSPLGMYSTKIREAADIEQAATVIIGIWNTNFKAANPSAKDANKIAELGYNNAGFMLMEYLKNRDGHTGGTSLFEFDGNVGKLNQKVSNRF